MVQALKWLEIGAEYIKARLAERSTWTAIGAGVTGAAALSAPWDYVFVAVGIIGTLVPSPNTKKDGDS